MKFGTLIEGSPKPKRKILNPEHFALGHQKWMTESFLYICPKKKLTLLQMRQKAEIWQTYGGTTQIRGKI
jgi:hypothetical protein